MILAFVTMLIIARLFRNVIVEILFSTILLGLVASYHFYLQPNLGLPKLAKEIQLYVGALLFFRSLIILFRIIPQTRMIACLVEGK